MSAVPSPEPSRRPPGRESYSAGEALWNVFRSVWLRGQRDCRFLGLTSAQARLIVAVDDGVSVLPSDLARRLDLSRQSMSSAMNHLEREGLVRRAHSPLDRRKVLVSFTAKGRRISLRLRERHHAVHERIDALFTKRERRQIARSLLLIARELGPLRNGRMYRCSLCDRSPGTRGAAT